tara:strand:+ start:3911 stop:4498 length:588 start_codon:yes stop_codon:yes gene_type:complete
MKKTKKINKKINKKSSSSKTFKKKDYYSGDGMLTTIWGPSMWHYLHTMSFNYPVKPTKQDKKYYKSFMESLQYVLPCKHCRENLKNNYKVHPLKSCVFKNRDSFSRYIYELHEIINKMLGKKSGLTFCKVRERYEHFRSRCTEEKPKIFNFRKTKKHKGCTEPLYGKKAKCVINIVPQDKKCETLNIDKKCMKTR